MSLSAVIQRPDKGPLGSIDEVLRELSRAFPGTEFTLIEREPSGVALVRSSPLLRFWIALFGQRGRYPYYSALYQDRSGFAAEFRFEVEAPIHEIRVTLYGRTTGANSLFQRLADATGWQVKFPPF
jgi:hypothetical protein